MVHIKYKKFSKNLIRSLKFQTNKEDFYKINLEIKIKNKILFFFKKNKISYFLKNKISQNFHKINFELKLKYFFSLKSQKVSKIFIFKKKFKFLKNYNKMQKIKVTIINFLCAYN